MPVGRKAGSPAEPAVGPSSAQSMPEGGLPCRTGRRALQRPILAGRRAHLPNRPSAPVSPNPCPKAGSPAEQARRPCSAQSMPQGGLTCRTGRRPLLCRIPVAMLVHRPNRPSASPSTKSPGNAGRLRTGRWTLMCTDRKHPPPTLAGSTDSQHSQQAQPAVPASKDGQHRQPAMTASTDSQR